MGSITEILNRFEPYLWVLEKKVREEQEQEEEEEEEEEEEDSEWICYSAGAE